MITQANTWIFRLVTLLALLLLASAGYACAEASETIAAIQGTGNQSPHLGERVTVTGIITFDGRGPGGLGGFFLQQADDRQDNNPASSEALFVYTDQSPGVRGQRVVVRGQVREYRGLTELTAVDRIEVCGDATLPKPLPVQLPLSESRREALEGMLVSLPQTLRVIDHDNLARFGSLTLAPQLQYTPTQRLSPGPQTAMLWQQQQEARLILDDGSNRRQPRPVPYPSEGLTLARSLRTAAQVTGLEGVLDYRYGDWRLHPTTSPRFDPDNPRPQAPARSHDSRLRLLTLNLGNYFNGDQGRFNNSRGAQNPEQFHRQTERLVAAVHASQADILAVTELENDGYGADSAIAALASALGEDWCFIVPTGGDGTDAIRVGLLYDCTRVEAVGPPQRPAQGLWRGLGRPPLAQHFRPHDGGSPVRIVITHLKSKRCHNARGDDRDQGDGQGCFAARRKASAQAIARWLQEQPAIAGSAGTLVTGDLNSYAREWPLQVFRAAGYRDLVNTPEATATSFRYQGRIGTLDYSLADTNLARHVVAAQVWSINTAEPRALDYAGDLAASSTGYPMPWRCSDHDPVITDIRL